MPPKPSASEQLLRIVFRSNVTADSGIVTGTPVCTTGTVLRMHFSYFGWARDHVQNPTPVTSMEARKLRALTA